MKDSFWFQHDSNAQHDERVLELRAEYGWEGYGLFWGLVEKMRDSPDYRLSMATVGGLSAGMGVLKPLLLGIIDLACKYGLLATEEDGAYFYSPSLRRRMGQWDSKKASLSEAGRIGAERKKALKQAATLAKDEATLKPPLSDPSTTLPVLQAHKITEHNKIERSTSADSATPSSAGLALKAEKEKEKELDFISFWLAYYGDLPKRGSKARAKKQWLALDAATRALILAGLDAHRADATRNSPDYLPYATTFLSKESWKWDTFGIVLPTNKIAPRIIPPMPDDPCSLWGVPNPDYDHRNYNQIAGQYDGIIN